MFLLISASATILLTAGILLVLVTDPSRLGSSEGIKIILGWSLMLFVFGGNTFLEIRKLKRKKNEEYVLNSEWLKFLLIPKMPIVQALKTVKERYEISSPPSTGYKFPYGKVIVHDYYSKETELRIIEKSETLVNFELNTR